MRTKMTSLHPRQLLIPVAVLLLILVAGRWVYGQWNEKLESVNERIQLRELQLNKYTRITQNSEKYAAVNRALLNLQDEIQKKRLFHSTTEALSQAKFQNVVKRLAKKNGIDIRSTKIISARREEDLTLLRLRIDAKAEVGSIRDFILDLQAENHYIFITDLVIRTISLRELRYYYLTAELISIQDI